MSIEDIRARIEAAPTSSAGDPPWLEDAKELLAALDATTDREKAAEYLEKFKDEPWDRDALKLVGALDLAIAALKKPVITDEMVERALSAYGVQRCRGVFTSYEMADMRATLTAALKEKP